MRQITVRLLAFSALLGALICSTVGAQQPGIPQEQRERLKTFAVETRAESRRLRDQVKRGRRELMRLYGIYVLDMPAVETALANLGKAQLGLLQIHFQSQKQLRQILTKDRFLEFRQRMERGRSRLGRFGEHAGDRYGLEGLSKLELTPDQFRKLQSARDMQAQARRAAELVMQKTKNLLSVYADYEIDEQTAEQAIDRIHKAQIRLSRALLRQEILLRSVLTEQQFQQLRAGPRGLAGEEKTSEN